MSVIRVNKNSNYTVMSNQHFRDRNLTLKAKGLLSLMLSLPDDWDYSISGLVAICKESKSAIQSILKELETFGYLRRTKVHDELGRIAYIYDIFENPCTEEPQTEEPQTETPCTENRFTVNPCTDNMLQLNTNILNTKELNTKEENTKKLNTKNKRFTPPTLEEVQAYCIERNNNVDAEHFVDYYQANGWKVGKNSMKDWKASVRTWERNGYSNSKPYKSKAEDELDDFYMMTNNWAQRED